MTQIIEVLISPDGQTKIESKGFTGRSCQDATRFIEEALGRRLSERLSAEYYLIQTQQENTAQHQ
jgi:hypothetical protein